MIPTPPGREGPPITLSDQGTPRQSDDGHRGEGGGNYQWPMVSIEKPSRLCRGYNYDSTSIRRAFDYLSKVVKVTYKVT